MSHTQSKKEFIKNVESLAEGQFLTSSTARRVTSDSTETSRVRVTTGRGDIKSFQVVFVSASAWDDIFDLTFTVSINGKETNIDLPAQQYFMSVGVGAGEGRFSGSGHRQKTVFHVPEGSIVEVKTIAGNLGIAVVHIWIIGYFTDLFIPRDPFINLKQHFALTVPDGVDGQERFVLPTARGRIVGMSLFTGIADISQIFDFDTGGNILINGVLIHENYPIWMFTSQLQWYLVNNWLINFEGGSVLNILFNNTPNGEPMKIGVTLYFSEMMSSKYRKADRGQREMAPLTKGSR